MDKKAALSHLAGKAILEFGRGGEGGRLISYHGAVTQTLLITLMEEGWLEYFANGEGARISPAGMRAYNRAMDEMGDGKLVAPKPTTQPNDAPKQQKHEPDCNLNMASIEARSRGCDCRLSAKPEDAA